MKLEFTMPAEVALVARPSQPISGVSPALSSAVTPSTPMRETGSCAPTRAQAMPSSTRCLARSRTEAGTCSSVVSATQVASRPVGPAGSVAGWAGVSVGLTATGASVVANAMVLSFGEITAFAEGQTRLDPLNRGIVRWSSVAATNSGSPVLIPVVETCSDNLNLGGRQQTPARSSDTGGSGGRPVTDRGEGCHP